MATATTTGSPTRGPTRWYSYVPPPPEVVGTLGFAGPSFVTLVVEEGRVIYYAPIPVTLADLPVFDYEAISGSSGTYASIAGSFSGGVRNDGVPPIFKPWDSHVDTALSAFFEPTNSTTNISLADDPASYTVTVNGSPATVSAVYRRSVPTRVAITSSSTRENEARHYVTLALASPLSPSDVVSVSCAGQTLSAAYTDSVLSEAVHIPLAGYPSLGPKRAYVGLWLGRTSAAADGNTNAVLSTSTAWTLRRISDGTVAASGTLAVSTLQTSFHHSTTNYNRCDLYVANFDSVTTAGEYRLEVAGVGSSRPFVIHASNMYTEQLRDCLRFLFYQRSGMAFTADMGDGSIVRPRNEHPADGLTVWQTDILCGRYQEGFTGGNDTFAAIHTWWTNHNDVNYADPSSSSGWTLGGTSTLVGGVLTQSGGYANTIRTLASPVVSSKSYTLSFDCQILSGTNVGSIRLTGGASGSVSLIDSATLSAGGSFSVPITGIDAVNLQLEILAGGASYRITNLSLTDDSVGVKVENPAAWGGHHDAGDWDRRPHHLFQLYYWLAEIFEALPAVRSMDFGVAEHGLTYDQLGSGSAADGDTGPATGGLPLPDLMHEILWGLSLWRRTQDRTSATVADGLGSIIGGVEYSNDGIWTSPSTDPVQYIIAYAPEDWSAYAFAAAAAKVGRILSITLSGESAPLDPVLGSRLIAEAEAAWTWAEHIITSAPHDASSSATNADIGAMRLRAAVALFRATGTAGYATIFEQLNSFSPTGVKITGPTNSDYLPHAYDYVRAGDEGRTINTTVRNAIRTWMNGRVATVDGSDKWPDYGGTVQYPQGTSWYSTGPSTNFRGTTMFWGAVYDGSAVESNSLTKLVNARDRLVRGSWWSLGCNPLNVSLVQGVDAPRTNRDAFDQNDRRYLDADRYANGIPGHCAHGCAVNSLRSFELSAMADVVYPKFANASEQASTTPVFYQQYLTRRILFCQENGIKAILMSRIIALSLLHWIYST